MDSSEVSRARTKIQRWPVAGHIAEFQRLVKVRMIGNTLANSLTGGGNDLLAGGAGDDMLVFDTDLALGSDTIIESGIVIDTLDFSGTTTRAVSIDLSNAAAQVVNAGLTVTLSANNTIENATGGASVVRDCTIYGGIRLSLAAVKVGDSQQVPSEYCGSRALLNTFSLYHFWFISPRGFY